MADRLTWQNVNAPDFSGSAQALAVAGRLLGDGFTGISTSLDGRMDRNKDAAASKAFAAAQGYTDAEAFDRAVAEKGFAGALGGIDPSQISPEMMQKLGERRGVLLDNAGTIADTGLTMANTGLAYANTNNVNASTDLTRAQIGWGNTESEDGHAASAFSLGKDQYGFDRTKTADIETDADKKLKEDSITYVDKNFVGGVDPDADRQAIINDRSIDPKTRAARLEAFDAAVPLLYTPDKPSQDRVNAVPAVVQIESSLGMYQNEVMMQDATNDDQMNWNTAKGTYGSSGNAKQQLLTTLQSNNGLLDPAAGLDKTAVTAAAGQVSDIFDKAKKAFPDVPDAMIAHVIGKNIKSDAWLMGWAGGKGLEPDESAAWQELEKYNDPSYRNTLEQGRIRRENESKSITEIKTDLAKSKEELARAYTKGLSQQVIDAKLKEIDALENRAATITGAKKLSNGNTPQSILNAINISASASNGASRSLPVQGTVNIAQRQQAKAFGLPEDASAYDAAMAQRAADMAAKWVGSSEEVDPSVELQKFLNR